MAHTRLHQLTLEQWLAHEPSLQDFYLPPAEIVLTRHPCTGTHHYHWATDQGICRYWARGQCRENRNCKFLHPRWKTNARRQRVIDGFWYTLGHKDTCRFDNPLEQDPDGTRKHPYSLLQERYQVTPVFDPYTMHPSAFAGEFPRALPAGTTAATQDGGLGAWEQQLSRAFKTRAQWVHWLQETICFRQVFWDLQPSTRLTFHAWCTEQLHNEPNWDEYAPLPSTTGNSEAGARVQECRKRFKKPLAEEIRKSEPGSPLPQCPCTAISAVLHGYTTSHLRHETSSRPADAQQGATNEKTLDQTKKPADVPSGQTAPSRDGALASTGSSATSGSSHSVGCSCRPCRWSSADEDSDPEKGRQPKDTQNERPKS